MRSLMRVVALTLLATSPMVLGAGPGVALAQTDARTHVLLVRTGSAVPASARTLARYDAFDVVAAAGADAARLRAGGATQRDDMRLVRLGRRSVDPSRAATGGADRGIGSELLVVQFVGPVKDAWLARLRRSSARVVSYMAENAYLVHAATRAERRGVRALARQPEVRAVIAFPTAAKLAPGVRTSGEQQVAVQTLSGADGSAARARLERVSDRSGRSASVGAFTSRVLRGDAAEFRRLAADPAVLSVAPRATPRLYDERAAMILASGLPTPPPPGYLGFLTTKGFGAGLFDFAIDVSDEGLDTGAVPGSHPDFFTSGNTSQPTRIAYVNNETTDVNGRDCGGHGTNVASIAAGYNDAAGAANTTNDAAGYNYGLGIAPRARIGATKIFNCAGNFDSSESFASMTSAAYARGARIVNNSWGADNQGAYTPDSQAFDAIVRDAQPAVAGSQEMVEVFAAGNDGDPGDGDSASTVGDPGTAKNVITVGAVESVRAKGSTDGCGVSDAGANSALDVIDFSSRGPTRDLRQKPDIMAPGTHVAGASPQHAFYDGTGTCDPQFPVGNTLYSLVSGTSQATPEVTGLAALVRDWYLRTIPGGKPPSPAMTKALLANTAQDLAGGDNGFGTPLGHRPDNTQGWGRVSLGEILDGEPRAFRDQTVELDASGQALTRSYTVADPARPVKVSLAWTDPPGPTTGNTFVNNLDLRVVAPDGSFYNGNVTAGGLSIANPSTADPRNNLENVFLPAGALTAGFQVTVTGTEIGGDGVPGDDDATDQDFAIVVSNASEQPTPGPPAGPGALDGASAGAAPPATTAPTVALAFTSRARILTLDRHNAFRWSFHINRPRLRGRVGFRSTAKVRVTRGRAKKRLPLGSARFTANSAGAASLRIKVSKRTARILRRLKRLKVTATLVAGGKTLRMTLTLKAPKVRRR